MQLRLRHIARNVLFNWLGTIANMAVGFLLSPFILHRLGNVAYGVWVLTVSVVGYLSLLDLGMQSSILRFVSQGHAKQDHQGASEATSAALWVRLQISALALLLSAGLAVVFPHVFKIPQELASDARKAIMLIGAHKSLRNHSDERQMANATQVCKQESRAPGDWQFDSLLSIKGWRIVFRHVETSK